jgi:acetyl-CoA C-acetyltransferase
MRRAAIVSPLRTGVRIMTTLLHEMKCRKARYGLETTCIGGGQGIAAICEGVW